MVLSIRISCTAKVAPYKPLACLVQLREDAHMHAQVAECCHNRHHCATSGKAFGDDQRPQFPPRFCRPWDPIVDGKVNVLWSKIGI